jgi:hypothetical protein
MIALVIALHCAPVLPAKPKPVYTRQQRLKDSFDILSKQPLSANYLYETPKLNGQSSNRN